MGGIISGRKPKILPLKNDSFDFALAPHVLGWENEERIRREGIKKSEFEFGEIIGISMFGMVQICRHKASGNFVACKCLSKKEVARLKQVESMKMEKEIMSQLNHPFIARGGGVFQDVNMLYLVVELAPGGDMFSLLKRQTNRRFEDGQAASVAVALQYLHNRDLLYRALNTENVCLDANGYIKLVDFQQVAGVVDRPNFGRSEHTGRRLSQKDAWTVSEHPGPELVHKLQRSDNNSDVYQHDRRRFTPHYFAPEVVQLKRHGKESDWWSFAIFVYELLCGYPPYFDSDPPGLYQKICRDSVDYPLILASMRPRSQTYVQPIVRDLMSKLLEKDRFKRLGYLGNADEIMKHNWFNNFSWQRLCYCKMKVPFVPNLFGPTDTKYFDESPDPTGQLPREVGSENRFSEAPLTVGAVFAVSQPYSRLMYPVIFGVWVTRKPFTFDGVGGPPITLLPPRHCLYGLDPSELPSEKTLKEWAEEGSFEEAARRAESGEGGDEGEGGEGGGEQGGGASEIVGEMEPEKQEVVDRLVESFGIDPQTCINVLNKVKWNEDKASEQLEKLAEKQQKNMVDDDFF